MGFGGRARSRGPKRQLSLQLTSLLDMFTIILVFLLESFQADDEDFVLHAGLSLPDSSARSPFKQAVDIAVSKDQVFVDGEVVYQLRPGGFLSEEVLDQGRLTPIEEAVEAAWKQRPADGHEEVVATIQADELIPYDTMDVVMRSAGFAGCYRFRLVIEKE